MSFADPVDYEINQYLNGNSSQDEEAPNYSEPLYDPSEYQKASRQRRPKSKQKHRHNYDD